MNETSNNNQNTLYKFGSWGNDNQKRILSEADIYFASADQFNDPFDLKIPFVFDNSELTNENIITKLMDISVNKNLSFDELLEEAKEKMRITDYKSKKFLDDANDIQKDYLNNHFGIFSLSKKIRTY
jgi:hypothetical protein